MKKLALIFCICLILAAGLFAVHAKAEAETAAEAEDPAWVAAYGQILDGWKAQIAEEPAEYSTPELYYLVYDIDKDGTPELIVKTGTCEADYHGALYTLRDGSAVQVGEEFGLGHSSFYSDPGENGIILMWGHMGYASAVRISLSDGYTEETLYEDNLNPRLEEDPDADYIYPGDVIPGSLYLTLCRGDVTLALTHYDEINRYLDGTLPEAAEPQYPNEDASFFDRVIGGEGEVLAVTADGFANSPGRIGFRELLRKDIAANYMQGDLSILSATPGDLNGDGQLECFIAASDGSSEVRIILSEQDGTVYAYLISYAERYGLEEDGSIFCSSEYYSFRCRLIFDADQAFLLSVPA